MNTTPTFLNPPIVEFVLGVQFAPLARMSSAHYGRFWDFLGNEWTKPRDNPPISDQFERFGGTRPANRLQLKLESRPVMPRLTLLNQSENRLLQFQPTRLHLNWRKKDDFYPSYKNLIEEFENTFVRFSEFCEREDIGPVNPNQWEITYVDAFPKGEYWNTLEEWGEILPGLFTNGVPRPVSPLRLETRAVEWGLEIEPQLGRLHVQASLGRWKDDQPDALMLNLTARGPLQPGHTRTLRDGLDLGHRVAVDQFLHMVSSDTQQRWGTKHAERND